MARERICSRATSKTWSVAPGGLVLFDEGMRFSVGGGEPVDLERPEATHWRVHSPGAEVRLSYEPATFTVGAFLSLITLGLAAAVVSYRFSCLRRRE